MNAMNPMAGIGKPPKPIIQTLTSRKIGINHLLQQYYCFLYLIKQNICHLTDQKPISCHWEGRKNNGKGKNEGTPNYVYYDHSIKKAPQSSEFYVTAAARVGMVNGAADVKFSPMF